MGNFRILTPIVESEQGLGLPSDYVGVAAFDGDDARIPGSGPHLFLHMGGESEAAYPSLGLALNSEYAALFSKAFNMAPITSTQRDALGAGQAALGSMVHNETTSALEFLVARNSATFTFDDTAIFTAVDAGILGNDIVVEILVDADPGEETVTVVGKHITAHVTSDSSMTYETFGPFMNSFPAVAALVDVTIYTPYKDYPVIEQPATNLANGGDAWRTLLGAVGNNLSIGSLNVNTIDVRAPGDSLHIGASASVIQIGNGSSVTSVEIGNADSITSLYLGTSSTRGVNVYIGGNGITEIYGELYYYGLDIRQTFLAGGSRSSATSLGTLSKKIEVLTPGGTSYGWIPVYTSIT